jgi:tetratricopeptide (TPR) repeat protein
MSDDHLTRELLRDLRRGVGDPSAFFERWLHHVLEVCPGCRLEFEAYRAETAHEPTHALGEVLRDSLGVTAQALARWEEERRHAEEEVAALLALAPEEREAAIGTRRFEAPAVAEQLLEVAFSQMARSPQQALTLSTLAKRVLARTRNSGLADRTYVLALAYQANAERILGRLEDAKESFADAHFFLARIANAGDRELRAELALLECSLARAKRDLKRAEKLGARALRTYRLLGFQAEVDRALVLLGTIHYEQGRTGLALQVTNEALEHLLATPGERLYLYARKNLALWLAELGNFEAAAGHLEATRPLLEGSGEQATCLRFRWVEGLVAEGQGDMVTAEEAFVEARQGFAELGQPYDAALAALHLAGLYLVEGRSREVKQLASELVPAFEALGIHREALTALYLFSEAVQREQLSIQLVGELVRYFRSARSAPGQPFRAAS